MNNAAALDENASTEPGLALPEFGVGSLDHWEFEPNVVGRGLPATQYVLDHGPNSHGSVPKGSTRVSWPSLTSETSFGIQSASPYAIGCRSAISDTPLFNVGPSRPSLHSLQSAFGSCSCHMNRRTEQATTEMSTPGPKGEPSMGLLQCTYGLSTHTSPGPNVSLPRNLVAAPVSPIVNQSSPKGKLFFWISRDMRLTDAIHQHVFQHQPHHLVIWQALIPFPILFGGPQYSKRTRSRPRGNLFLNFLSVPKLQRVLRAPKSQDR